MITKYRKWCVVFLIIVLTVTSSCSSEAGEQEAATSPTPTATPTATSTPTPPPGPQGPFVVEQIMSLGGESIAGSVCRTTQAFVVTFTTPAVSFITNFVPATAYSGGWTYNYSIPSGPESHDASGAYTIGQADADGKLLLSMTGSDHVVGNGFDFSQTINYEFNLVFSNTSC